MAEKRKIPEMSSCGDPKFIEACRDAGVPTTRRQLSKWNNGYGAAARVAGRNTRRDPLRGN